MSDLILTEQAAGFTPAAGKHSLYYKTDGKLYTKDSTGVEVLVSSSVAPAVLGAVQVFTKNQSVAPSVLVSGASIPVDASLSNNFRLVLGVNAALANPTGLTDGMVLNFRIKQDATGGRTLAYGTAYKFPGGTAPGLSLAANAVDLMSCYYDVADGTLSCNMTKAFA